MCFLEANITITHTHIHIYVCLSGFDILLVRFCNMCVVYLHNHRHNESLSCICTLLLYATRDGLAFSHLFILKHSIMNTNTHCFSASVLIYLYTGWIHVRRCYWMISDTIFQKKIWLFFRSFV